MSYSKHPLWQPPPSGATDIEIAPGVRMPLVSGGNSGQRLWLKQGGRALDTAFHYGDKAQTSVGQAIAPYPRSEVFVTTKVMCCPSLIKPEVCTKAGMKGRGYGNHLLVTFPKQQLDHSLRMLNTSYVDLVLLHQPCLTWEGTMKAWRTLEEAQRAGKIRAIGVSNFNATQIERLVHESTIKPATNQVMYSIAGHPKKYRIDETGMEYGSAKHGSDYATLAACRKHGVTLYAYSPLGKSSKIDVLGHPIVQQIATAHNYTPAQVALRWSVQQGIPVITSSRNSVHVDQALAVPNLMLSDEEMDLLEQAEQLE